MPKTCPLCGTILERPWLPRVKQDIYDFIMKNPGCNWREVYDWVYRNDSHLGRDYSTFATHLTQMRPTLESHGLRLVADRGRLRTYRIVEIKVPANACV